jgi:hypothetical protein
LRRVVVVQLFLTGGEQDDTPRMNEATKRDIAALVKRNKDAAFVEMQITSEITKTSLMLTDSSARVSSVVATLERNLNTLGHLVNSHQQARAAAKTQEAAEAKAAAEARAAAEAKTAASSVRLPCS